MFRKQALLIVAIAAGFALASCGGGGGGSSGGGTTAQKISGTAAAGGPIIGKVTVRDSSTPPLERETDIEANGSYSVSVAGMTAPFAFRADGDVGGRRYSLYSAATSGDINKTINITPFTDLILANIASDLASTYFNSSQFKTLTPTQLNNANAALRTQLLPILQGVGLSSSLDILRDSFSANHTLMDGVLDVVQVSTDSDTKVAQIKNIITDNAVTMNISTGGFTGTFTTGDGTAAATGLTDIQLISALLSNFTSLYANSVPSANNPTLLNMFDLRTGMFMYDGLNIDQFIGQITNDPNMRGIQFSNIRILDFSNSGQTCEVALQTSLNGRVLYDAPHLFFFNKVGGAWKNAGNQHVADWYPEVRAYYYADNAMYSTGITFIMHDRGSRGVKKAIVKGPGLPAEGLVYVKVIDRDDLVIQGNPEEMNQYEMSNEMIDQIPMMNAEYSIIFYDANDAAMNDAYRTNILARPYKRSELSPSLFAAITAPSDSAFAAWNGGNLTVQWTKPVDTISDYLWVRVSGIAGSAETETGLLSPTSTSAAINLAFQTGDGTQIVPNNKTINVGIVDDVNHEMATVKFWNSN